MWCDAVGTREALPDIKEGPPTPALDEATTLSEGEAQATEDTYVPMSAETAGASGATLEEEGVANGKVGADQGGVGDVAAESVVRLVEEEASVGGAELCWKE